VSDNILILKAGEDAPAHLPHDISIEIVEDEYVNIEQNRDLIVLTMEQAKQLTYFLNSRIIRLIDFGDD
jgi:hypothetical protein